MPTILNSFKRGIAPKGREVSSSVIMVNLSPNCRSKFSARPLPIKTLKGLSNRSLAFPEDISTDSLFLMTLESLLNDLICIASKSISLMASASP